MDQRPIGVLDTGAEGLAFARALQRALPNEDILFLADSAASPYGGRSRDWIVRRARLGLEYLRGRGAKLIASACGSVGALVSDADTKHLGVPFLSLLLPCAQMACATSVSGVIGVIGSTAAVRSSAFAKTVRNIRSEARVVGKAAPLLTPLAQTGRTSPEDMLLGLAAREVLDPLLREKIDTLILGSSHFSPLYGALSAATNYGVNLIDASAVTADYVAAYLLQNALSAERAEAGRADWLVTDAAEPFRETARLCYGREFTDPIEAVAL